MRIFSRFVEEGASVSAPHTPCLQLDFMGPTSNGREGKGREGEGNDTTIYKAPYHVHEVTTRAPYTVHRFTR